MVHHVRGTNNALGLKNNKNSREVAAFARAHLLCTFTVHAHTQPNPITHHLLPYLDWPGSALYTHSTIYAGAVYVILNSDAAANSAII